MSKIALLIGVSEFSESNFKPLPSAEEDIKAMARVLQQPELGGVDQVQALPNPTRVNNSRSDRQVLVFDCCFSGAIATGMKIKDDGSVAIQQQLGGKGRAIFTSSNSIEYSFHRDEFKLSVYTHFWVEGIEKGVADRDGDGWVSADELHEYVSANEGFSKCDRPSNRWIAKIA